MNTIPEELEDAYNQVYNNKSYALEQYLAHQNEPQTAKTNISLTLKERFKEITIEQPLRGQILNRLMIAGLKIVAYWAPNNN